MRILFDKNAPYPLRRFLSPHMVRTADEFNWGNLANGELLSTAEEAGFDVMVSADQHIRYQQNLAGRKISLVVIGLNVWQFVEEHLPAIVRAVDQAKPGGYTFVEIPLPPKPAYRPSH